MTLATRRREWEESGDAERRVCLTGKQRVTQENMDLAEASKSHQGLGDLLTW